ncbi:Rrf2 family transcriptional regulator [Chitinophaga lutea]
MIRSKFATSVHILSLLGSSPEEWMSSDFIAGSLNSNPAMVRKEISMLREAGLVESKEGKNGGARLAKPMADIRLSEIFALVKNDHIFGFSPNEPNPSCPVGARIKDGLDGLFTELDDAVARKLHGVSLAEFIKKYL